jgi:hypothetical protein
MRCAPALHVFVLLSGLVATAQVLPRSNGSCRVTASGLESCDWWTGDNRSELFVTRYILASGAPLNPPIEGREVLIVGMSNGELLNEKKLPQDHINVRNGLVMLMPKEEPYLLRNVGNQSVELLLIEVRK